MLKIKEAAMDKKELINIYSNYQAQINDIWRSL